MKWFKHNTDASRSLKLNQLIEKFGLEGYARYWLLIELLSEKFNGKDTSFKIHNQTLRLHLRYFHMRSASIYLQSLSDLNLVSISIGSNYTDLKCDKLLEIKDNHTKNLQVTFQEVSENLPLDKKKNKNKNKNKKYIKKKINSDESDGGDKFFKENMIAEFWNIIAEDYGLAKVKLPLSVDRIKNIQPALKEFPEREDWEKIILEIPKNKFNLGEGDKSWKANFDWLFYTTKFNYRKLWEQANG